MKHNFIRKTLPILTVVILLLSVLLPPAVFAFAKSSGEIKHVYDKAGLLSTNELNNVEKMCAEYSSKDNLDIIILTHNDANAVDPETYIENFYDSTLDSDSVILLVDMAGRNVFIEGYGTAEQTINSGRIDQIINKITPDLTSANYPAAFEEFINLSDQYVNTPPIYQNVWIHLAIALVIGAATVAIMAYNAGGRMTVGGATYMDPNHSGLIGRRDDYIRTLVTRVRRPQNNGGGGGGGISAGGNSHSSGGGKF